MALTVKQLTIHKPRPRLPRENIRNFPVGTSARPNSDRLKRKGKVRPLSHGIYQTDKRPRRPNISNVHHRCASPKIHTYLPTRSKLSNVIHQCLEQKSLSFSQPVFSRPDFYTRMQSLNTESLRPSFS